MPFQWEIPSCGVKVKHRFQNKKWADSHTNHENPPKLCWSLHANVSMEYKLIYFCIFTIKRLVEIYKKIETLLAKINTSLSNNKIMERLHPTLSNVLY